MHVVRKLVGGAVAVAAGLLCVAAAFAAEGPPPPPKAANGQAVEVVGGGLATPTAFAFGAGQVFVGAFGSEDGTTPGGVYVLRGGQAVQIRGLPSVAGLVWKSGTLYASVFIPGKAQVMAFRRWNGTTFASKRVIWTGPKRFSGLNGIAIGWDNRLYAGVGLSPDGDTKKSNRPFAQSVISMRLNGTDVKQVAGGMRQPWQLTFVKGVPRPYVTVLGQENLGKKEPPDWIVVARDGSDFGFPTCRWSKAKPDPQSCESLDRPLITLPAHSSPTGISASGSTLYVALFNGIGRGPTVVTIAAKGGAPRPFLTGFVAPVVAVGVSGNRVYAGDLTGQIYRVKK